MSAPSQTRLIAGIACPVLTREQCSAAGLRQWTNATALVEEKATLALLLHSALECQRATGARWAVEIVMCATGAAGRAGSPRPHAIIWREWLTTGRDRRRAAEQSDGTMTKRDCARPL